VAALLYAMWRGQNWARWLLVAIYVVGLALRLTLISLAAWIGYCAGHSAVCRSSFAGGTAQRRGIFGRTA
jgi:hypothetical protein